MGSLLALFILFPLLDQYSKFLYWHPTMNGVGICVLGFILVVVIVGVIFSWCGACRSIRKREGRGRRRTFQRLERERFNDWSGNVSSTRRRVVSQSASLGELSAESGVSGYPHTTMILVVLPVSILFYFLISHWFAYRLSERSNSDTENDPSYYLDDGCDIA